MKKFIATVLSGIMCLSLCACDVQKTVSDISEEVTSSDTSEKNKKVENIDTYSTDYITIQGLYVDNSYTVPNSDTKKTGLPLGNPVDDIVKKCITSKPFQDV